MPGQDEAYYSEMVAAQLTHNNREAARVQMAADAVQAEPVKWARMTRTLVYEGPEEWVQKQRNSRALKESMYLPYARITEELTITELDGGERKVAEVAINLARRNDAGMAGVLNGGAYDSGMGGAALSVRQAQQMKTFDETLKASYPAHPFNPLGEKIVK